MKHLPMAAAAVLTAAATTGAAPRFLNERHGYIRGEKIELGVDAGGAKVITFDVSGWLTRRVRVARGGAAWTIDSSLLRAGDYVARASAAGESALFPLWIAPERNAQRFPLWSWHGAYSNDLQWWVRRGFNGFRFPSSSGPVPPGGNARFARILDEGTRLGADMGAYLTPLNSPRWKTDEAARALLPGGQRSTDKVYPLEPAVLEHARRTAEAWVARFAGYPSFRHALLSSEYQTPFALNPEALERARREAGIDLKQVLRREWIAPGSARIDPARLPPQWQPSNGIIADDNPVYRFLKWWWQRGHGTSGVDAIMAKAIKARRPDVAVWHDPYRLAPVYGSHTGLDYISTWTYGHPDIKRLAYTTVLQAAARPEHQKVMQDITMWVYGRFVVPIGTPTANLLSDKPGKDPYFTQVPDYMREALWLVMSQRPDAICFYYAGSLPPENPALDPYIASPEAFDAIGEVSRSLIEPYGPAVLQCRRARARVAVLMSAASVWFPGGPLLPGYLNEQIMPFCALLMMNHVPFDVLLDDDIVAGRLRGYDALVLTRADTLTRSMHRRIEEFARGGGKVIADATLRARVAGAVLTGFDFSFERQVDGSALAAARAITATDYRARMEAYAEQLKPLLAGIPLPAGSDSKRVLLNTLESGDLRYVFAVNDDRIYGPRFGQWKLMLESGVRQRAKVRLAAPAGAAIYDAVARRLVSCTAAGGTADCEITLAPARGKLLAVLPRAIGKVAAHMPASCERGKPCGISVRVLDASGDAVRGAVPLRIEISDPLGRPSEYNRFAATEADGSGTFTCSLPYLPALNDLPGEWTLRVTELLGGSQAETVFRVW